MEETLISDDDNKIINIIEENPYILTAKKVPGEFYPDLDYKNFTKVNINGIAFLHLNIYKFYEFDLHKMSLRSA